MAYRDLTETLSLTMPDWADGSSWTFRRHLTDNDETAAAKTAFAHHTDIDQTKLRAATRRGEDYTPEFRQEVKENAQLALLEVMSVGWSGPEFAIPAEHHGKPVKDPHAGSTPPVTIAYMNVLLNPRQLEDVYARLKKIWAGRTEDEQEMFREGDSHVASAGPAASDETAVPVPAGD